MRSLLISLALGFAAVGVVVLAGALALGVVADANGWPSLRIALGPLTLLDYERTSASSSTTFGTGLAVVAGAGGVLNAAAATVLRRGRGGPREHKP